MIEQIADALGEDESVRFEISRNSTGIVVALIPTLKDKTVPKEANDIRAALTMPLIERGANGKDVEAHFREHFEKYTEARQELKDTFEQLLGTLKDANKKGKDATEKAGNNGEASKKSGTGNDKMDVKKVSGDKDLDF